MRSDSLEPTMKRLSNATCTLVLGYEVGLHYQSLHPINSESTNMQQALLVEKLNNEKFHTLNAPTTINSQTELKTLLQNLMLANQTKVQVNQELYDELMQSTLLLGEKAVYKLQFVSHLK